MDGGGIPAGGTIVTLRASPLVRRVQDQSKYHARLIEDCERLMPELPEIANLARQMTKQL